LPFLGSMQRPATPPVPARRTTATVLPGSPGYDAWLALFGTDTVLLESPFPILGTAPVLPETALFYKVDTAALSPERRARLVRHCAVRLGLPVTAVEAALADPRHGLPILLDEDVVVSDDPDVAAGSGPARPPGDRAAARMALVPSGGLDGMTPAHAAPAWSAPPRRSRPRPSRSWFLPVATPAATSGCAAGAGAPRPRRARRRAR
jgi:hypothetical protein